MVRRDHVDIRIVQRPHRHAVQRLAVEHQVVRIELLDVRRYLARPFGRRRNLVARLPAENRRLIAIGHARERVLARDHVLHGGLEIVDELAVRPKFVGRLAAKRRVFTDAAPPLVLIHERNDDANSLAPRDRKQPVQRAKTLLVELARPEHVHTSPMSEPSRRTLMT